VPAPPLASAPALASYNPPMHKLLPTAAALGLCASLAACGLKGDLYLPPPKEQAAPPATPADAGTQPDPATPADPATPTAQPEDEEQKAPTG